MRPVRIAVLAAVPVLVVPLMAAGTAAAAVHAKGQVTCSILNGTGTLSPGLTPAGITGGVKINFKGGLILGGCNSMVTKPTGDMVKGGYYKGTGFYNAPVAGVHGSSCTNFDGPDNVGQITVTITWITSGAPIAPTKIVYTGNPGTVTGAATDTITLNAPPGAAVKSGSFTGTPALALTKLVTNLPAPPCGAGPFAAFNINGGQVHV